MAVDDHRENTFASLYLSKGRGGRNAARLPLQTGLFEVPPAVETSVSVVPERRPVPRPAPGVHEALSAPDERTVLREKDVDGAGAGR